jgi:hypothetical protein
MSKNILILLLSSHKYPSPRNEDAQNFTWIKDAQKCGIEVIQFIGGYEKRDYVKPYLRLTSGDSIEDVGYKTIETFDWALQNKKFDYIFRVNSSSYVNINKLIHFIENVQEGSLYAGKIIELSMLNLRFISGSGIILDKDSVRNIVENKKLWNHSFIDDVAMGDICTNLNISPTSGNFFELQKNVFSYKELDESYHFRCKLEDYGYPRFLESVNMLNLSKIQNNVKISRLYKIFSIFIFELIKLINLKFYLNKYIFRNRHLKNFLREYKNKLLKKLSK